MMGLMFYVRPDQEFLDALLWGIEYYRNKYNQEPKVCHVHPSVEIKDAPLEIKADQYVLVRNYWIIYETDKSKED
jgi:hypothetical protein